MKKWLVIGGVLIVGMVALVFFGLSKLGPIIQKAVNTYGPEITRTQVQLGDVGVSLFSGEAKLKDLLIGNPEGFNSGQAMRIGSLYVNVDEKSLTGDTIVIDTIEILEPEITYEKSARTDNFQAIIKNVKQTLGSGQESKQDQTAAQGGGKKLLIRNFTLKNGKVNLAMAALPGQNVTATLPDIELQNVGGKQEGVAPAQAISQILTAVYKQIQSPEVMTSLNQQLKQLGVDIKGVDVKALETKAKEEATGVTDKVKGLFGN